MLVHHRTTPAAARAILARGFDDAYVDPNPEHWHSVMAPGGPVLIRGVWFASHPLDAEEIGATPATHMAVLAVEVPAEVLAPYDVGPNLCTNDGQPIHQWCVPTALVNAHAIILCVSTGLSSAGTRAE